MYIERGISGGHCVSVMIIIVHILQLNIMPECMFPIWFSTTQWYYNVVTGLATIYTHDIILMAAIFTMSRQQFSSQRYGGSMS